jgi:hypothetical protein
VVFTTAEALTADDTDMRRDVYERAGGITTRISQGPLGGNGAWHARFAAFASCSAEGSPIFFYTDEKLTSDDLDTAQDLYEHTADGTTRVSQGPTGGNAGFGATFQGASRDGSRVILATEEKLTANDADTYVDLYVRTNGTTTLLSRGPAGGNGPYHAGSLGGVSDDGRTVYFSTEEALTSDDSDTHRDIYQRSFGATTRVSLGPIGGNAGRDASLASADGSAVSADGSAVIFSTAERLTSDDVDGVDLYKRANGVTTLLSRGVTDQRADFAGASADASRVFFTSAEALTADDLDNQVDIYQGTSNGISRLSRGPAGGNGGFDASGFSAATADGSRVFFHTREALTSDDTDSALDVYRRTSSGTTLISKGPAGGNGDLPVNQFDGISEDASRVFFSTKESLTADDTDSDIDIYERSATGTTRVSVGPLGGNGAFYADFRGASLDGSVIFFDTAEKLTGDDGDRTRDIYKASGP